MTEEARVAGRAGFVGAFSVYTPEPAREIPVVVEVPHAGLFVDAPALATMVAPLRALGRDADLFVDELYADVAALGATLIVAHASRYVIDLNRGPDDYDGISVDQGGAQALPRGLIWRTGTEGDPILGRRLTQAELLRRKRVYYEPYHRTVEGALAAKKARFGCAVLLAAHSMPSQGRRGHVDVGVGRADVVPGTRGGTTAASSLIRTVERVCAEHPASWKHDDPYKGGFSTGHYGAPERDVHAIQIELARRLYMDEDRLVPLDPGFERTRALCEALVTALGAAARPGLAQAP